MNIKERLLRLRLAAVGDIQQPKLFKERRQINMSPQRFLDLASSHALESSLAGFRKNLTHNTGKYTGLSDVHSKDEKLKTTSIDKSSNERFEDEGQNTLNKILGTGSDERPDYRKYDKDENREIFRGDELGNVEYYKRLIRRGEPMYGPALWTDEKGKVTGHEGRHRSRAFMEEGVEEIPINIFGDKDPKSGQVNSLDELQEEIDRAERLGFGGIKKEVEAGFGEEKKTYTKYNPISELKDRLKKVTTDTRAPIFGRFSKQRTAIQTKHNVRINPQQGLEIADAYDQLQHRPNDPDVKAAYDAFNKETMDQFNKLRRAGLQITKLKPNQKGYSSAEEMHKDILENQHLSYFPSESGFGSSEVKDHPMLQGSGIIDAEGKEMPYNDIFRIVHDIQGHNLGNKSDFSPEGEHAAYLTHKQQYSPLAQRALFTETAGQANWGAFNRKSGARNRDLISRGRFNELEFAPQKADILSDEFINREFHI